MAYSLVREPAEVNIIPHHGHGGAFIDSSRLRSVAPGILMLCWVRGDRLFLLNKIVVYLRYGILCALVTASSADAQNYMQMGNWCMRIGDYQKAVAYFQGELSANPLNASAHNDLATTYMLMKMPVQAEKEFRRAAEIDFNGPIGLNARKALAQLKAPPVVIFRPVASAETKPSPVATKNGVTVLRGINPEKKIIAAQEARERALDLEYKDRVAKVTAESEGAIAKLQQEQNQRLAAEGLTIVDAHSQTARNGTAATMALYEEYAKKIEEVQNDKDARLTELKKDYESKRASIKGTREMLHAALSKRRLNDNVQLVPTGSDVYSRTYRTWGEPSGNPIPLIGEQRSLKRRKHKVIKGSHQSASNSKGHSIETHLEK